MSSRSSRSTDTADAAAERGERLPRRPARQSYGSSAPVSGLRRLHAAIDDRDEKKATDLLRSCISESVDLDCLHRGRPALVAACAVGLRSLVHQLLASGADPNAADENGLSPLQYVCTSGDIELVTTLLQHGARTDVAGDSEGTPLLEVAVRHYSDELCSLLISSSSSTDSLNRKGQTALHVCAELEKSHLAELLLRKGCNVNAEDDSRRTPLSIAAGNGCMKLICLLIEAGASLNAQDVQKSTALLCAVQGGFHASAKALIDAGADQSLSNAKRTTPLMCAVQARDLAAIEMLLGAGRVGHQSALDASDWQGSTPLTAAVRVACAAVQPGQGKSSESSQAEKAVHMLVHAGCSVNKAESATGQTPLMLSCMGSSSAITDLLLTAGAVVNAVDIAGNTALHTAVEHANVDAVKMLLQAEGCNVNASNADGQTPIFKAANSSVPVQIVELLVTTAHADVNVQDAKRHTPLHEAIASGRSQMAVFLINAGCRYNVLDADGMSPACLACQKSDRLVLAKLLAKPDCDVNLGMELPLHVAIRKGNRQLAEGLIARGASISLLNADGQSPMLLAVEANNEPIINLLLRLGAPVEMPRRWQTRAGGGTRLDVDGGAASSSSGWILAEADAAADGAVATGTAAGRRCCLIHEDAHPHVVLQPLFECVRFENVRLFKLLLDYHYRPPYGLLKTLHDMITVNHVDGRTLLSDSARSEVLFVLRSALESVCSLQQLCRGAVRECLGPNTASKVAALPLPSALRSFLLFDEASCTGADAGRQAPNL